MPRRRKEQGTRKIEENVKGRVWWKPGEPHPLDQLDDELKGLRDQLPGEIEALMLAAHQTEQHLHALKQIENEDDPTAAFTAADQLASRIVIERFHDRKHEHHLRTIFAIQRRKRLMGRLQAIRAALDLANGLLREDDTLSNEFLTTWREKTTQEERTPEQEQEELNRIQEEQAMSPSERRTLHLDEPLAPMVGSVELSRQLLRDFEAQLPALRAGLVAANGWIEIFYVPKRRYKNEVVAYWYAWDNYRDHKSPIPEEIEQAIDPRVAAIIRAGANIPTELREQAYDITQVGPYAKYRWREDKRTYSVSLGLLGDYPEHPFIPAGF
jgi:hypothetical protein